MDREQAQDLFSLYWDGELPSDQAKAFEAFLESDEETRAEYERFRRALESLSMLSEQPAPDDFVEKLQRRMRRRSGGKLFGTSRWGTVSRVPYELFSLVLILIILTVYMLTLPVLRVSDEGRVDGAEPSVQPEDR
jgi:anti-sigma factor RsiW